MQRIKKTFKYILVISVICCTIVSLICYSWVIELKEKKWQLDSEIHSSQNILKTNLSFEEGGRFYLDDFKLMLLFSDNKNSPDEQITKLVKENSILIKEKFVYFQKSITKNIINENLCKDIYCYRINMPFEKISPYIWKALMGVEDIRFLNHKGIDLKSLFRALIVDIIALKYKQGGSTLTQQFIKNFFLKNEKSLKRKFKEFVWSIYLESNFTKKEIISFYLNYVYWGSFQGIKIKGITAASLFYFYKNLNDISAYESTILISLLKGPSYYHPIRRTERLKKRANLLFKKLKNEKMFQENELAWSEAEWNKWISKLKLNNSKRKLRHMITAINDKTSDFDLIDRYIMFKASENILSNVKKKYKENIFSYKVFIGNINTGKILNMYSRAERKKDVAIYKEFHSVGSILKPLIYSILSNDFGVNMDEKIRTDRVNFKLLSGNWSPREAHDKLPNVVDLRYALQHSLNRPVVKVVNRVGFDNFEPKLSEYIPELKKPLSQYPAQLLGAIELPVSRVFEIYKKLLSSCKTNEKIKNVLNILTDPTKTTISHRVGNLLGNYKFFGKTGTSNGGMNNWFIFSQGNLFGVIWFGREEKGKKENYKLYGSNTAFLIYKNFILNRGKPISEFECF